MLIQIIITICGISSIWLVGRKENWRKYGYVIGLVAQPFWFIWAYQTESWGILIMSIFYAYSWAQGVYNHFEEFKKRIHKVFDIPSGQ